MNADRHDKLIQMLVGEYGLVARELQRQLKPGISANGMADYAGGFSSSAIECLMVGMEREALELLAKSDEWMTIALTARRQAR